MSYYRKRYNSAYEKQGYDNSYKPDDKVFLFICLTSERLFIAHSIKASGHNLVTIITLHQNMFPAHNAVAVIRCSTLEATLMTRNFNSHKLTYTQFASNYQQNTVQQEQIYTSIDSNGMTSVYLETNQFGVTPTLVRCAQHFGYIVNPSYLSIIFKLLNYEQFDNRTTHLRDEASDERVRRGEENIYP